MGATLFEFPSREDGSLFATKGSRCDEPHPILTTELPASFTHPGAPGMTRRQALRESYRLDSQLAKNSLPVVPFDFLVDWDLFAPLV
jgi:hypothetical protein